MNIIPTYALYGEAESERHDWLHWETIQSRSGLHGYRIGHHRHEQFFQILSLTGGGAGDVTLDGTKFSLVPPMVVVVPAHTVHGYTFSPDVEGVIVTLMARDLEEGIESPTPAVIGVGSASVHQALIELIAEADQPGDQHDLAMRARLTLLQVALHRARREPVTQTGVAVRARLHATAFRTLVDQNCRETRRIVDYASAIGISQTHLNRVCRQVFGTSALGVIESRIALEARRQLLFSSLSIKQIGAGLGYDDPAYFTRMLKRVLGVSPLAFRKRAEPEISATAPPRRAPPA